MRNVIHALMKSYRESRTDQELFHTRIANKEF